MILGLDFYGTITKHPQAFRELAESVIQFDPVYIVSAVKKGNRAQAERDVRKSLIQYTEIIILEYEKFNQVPQMKLEACKEKDIKLFIDDRKDTIELLNSRGVVALLTF